MNGAERSCGFGHHRHAFSIYYLVLGCADASMGAMHQFRWNIGGTRDDLSQVLRRRPFACRALLGIRCVEPCDRLRAAPRQVSDAF